MDQWSGGSLTLNQAVPLDPCTGIWQLYSNDPHIKCVFGSLMVIRISKKGFGNEGS